jgi:alkanesulfonate monooxygenase SsuD/methylene tetrahydromethanopterin reductase-like flavin-dependent oxidoreductase (luciferase family)
MRVGIALLFQNYLDMDRFEAAERGEVVGGPVVQDSQVMRDQFALADLVEPLGFDSLWTFEHRSTPYILLPNPQQFIAYFAARTKRIDFGTMVTVLPWHDPIRLAENLSLLTHMLGPDRRVRMGLGRGLSRREYASLGLEMAQSRQRFTEGLAVLREAFHSEAFSYRGEVFNYSRSSVRPRPLTTDVVDDAYAVWTSPDSMEVAASQGLSPLTIPSKDLESFKADLGTFDDLRAKHGYGPAKPPILQLFMYCNKDSAYAHEVADRYVGEYAEGASRHYEFGGAHFNHIPSYESYRDAGSSRLGGSSMAEVTLGSKQRILREAVVGSPEECLEKIAQCNEMMRPQEIALVATPGSIPKHLAAESISLFSEAVLPKAQRIGSTRAAIS